MSIFPTKILLATDGSQDAELAASSAVELAKAGASELHVLHVGPGLPLYELPDYPARFEEVVAAQRQEAQSILDDQVKGVEALGATVVGVHLEMDERPDRATVELGEKLGAGLVVMGSRGLGGLRRTLMGSVSDSVVRHAHCPVIVARWKPVAFPAKILLATDGSEGARLAATTAADVAQRTGSDLHVVHVGEVRPVYHPERHGYLARYDELQEGAQRLLDGQVEQLKAAGARVAGTHLGMGRPDEKIIVLGQEIGAGLIVTGSRGLGGLRRALMGSVSDSVVRHAHCPVMVVRPE